MVRAPESAQEQISREEIKKETLGPGFRTGEEMFRKIFKAEKSKEEEPNKGKGKLIIRARSRGERDNRIVRSKKNDRERIEEKKTDFLNQL